MKLSKYESKVLFLTAAIYVVCFMSGCSGAVGVNLSGAAYYPDNLASPDKPIGDPRKGAFQEKIELPVNEPKVHNAQRAGFPKLPRG